MMLEQHGRRTREPNAPKQRGGVGVAEAAGGNERAAKVGPTAVGNIKDLESTDTFKAIAGAYVSAFSQNAQDISVSGRLAVAEASLTRPNCRQVLGSSTRPRRCWNCGRRACRQPVASGRAGVRSIPYRYRSPPAQYRRRVLCSSLPGCRRRAGSSPQAACATLPTADLTQLMLVFTSRANPILGDFIRHVYWARYAGGYTQITNDDARAFVERGIDDGKTAKRWSETTVRRVSRLSDRMLCRLRLARARAALQPPHPPVSDLLHAWRRISHTNCTLPALATTRC